MLNAADNELLTRVGPDTPMGQWLRRFWTPLMLSSQLPEPDGAPKEVRILGEDLLVFRDTDGQVGALQPLCPHRQAPLVYGRNEERGLRCIYHGWKFDVQGQCLDMPNEPADSQFKHKVRAGSYPIRDVAGLIWIYMGPRNLEPALPDMEWMRVPATHRNVAKFSLEGNWVQAMEGDVDSSHVPFLHSELHHAAGGPQLSSGEGTYNSRWIISGNDGRYLANDRAPRWLIQPTQSGMMIAAQRNAEADSYYWRINQIYFPYYTFVAGPTDQSMFLAHFWVPIDDHHTDIWTAFWCPGGAMNDEERDMMFSGPNAHIATYNSETGGLFSNRANHFFQDRELQRTRTYSGIRGVREQDGAVTLGMGPIVDRTKEHLGTADTAVIALRRLLLREAKNMMKGEEPYAPSHPEAYRDRAWSGVLQRNDDFLGDPEAQKMMVTLVP